MVFGNGLLGVRTNPGSIDDGDKGKATSIHGKELSWKIHLTQQVTRRFSFASSAPENLVV